MQNPVGRSRISCSAGAVRCLIARFGCRLCRRRDRDQVVGDATPVDSPGDAGRVAVAAARHPEAVLEPRGPRLAAGSPLLLLERPPVAVAIAVKVLELEPVRLVPDAEEVEAVGIR